MNHRLRKGFTLVEIMIVVAILGIITAIAIPTFFRARELARMRACQENMAKIDGAKQQWALENNLGNEAVPIWDNLVGASNYIRKTPVCPAGGEYTIGAMSDDPNCTLSTQDPFPHDFESTPPGGGGSSGSGTSS